MTDSIFVAKIRLDVSLSIKASLAVRFRIKASSTLILSPVMAPAWIWSAVTEPAAIFLAVTAPSTNISDCTLTRGAMISTPLGLAEMVEANCSPVKVVEPMVTPSGVTCTLALLAASRTSCLISLAV